MGKVMASFRIDEEEWKEFKESVPNASNELREFVKDKIQSTKGLENKQRQLKRKIIKLEEKIEEVKHEKQKVDRRLESREKLAEKAKQSKPDNGFDYDTEYITDKWRDSYDKILAVHVNNPQTCQECGEEIEHGTLVYFNEDEGNFYGHKHFRTKSPNGSTPAILMTDLEVKNN